MEAWLKRQEESFEAYRAFEAYLNLGSERSVLAAYRQVSGKIDARQAGGTWNKWVKLHQWQERATAYDRWQREQKYQAEAEQIRSKRFREMEDERIAELTFTRAYDNLLVKMMRKVADKLEKLESEKLSVNNVASFMNVIANGKKLKTELADRVLHIEQLTEALKDKLGE